MKKIEIYQKTENLIEAIKSLICEATDELAAEHVENLIVEIVEEAISNHYGLVESNNNFNDEMEKEPIDFYPDMDEFPSDE